MNYVFYLLALIGVELAYFRIANQFNIIDKPNERSSHTRITFRGGGVVFYLAILFYFMWEGFQYPWFFGGLTLIAFVSFADDIRPQSTAIRLLTHFLAVALMFYQWGLFDNPWYLVFVAWIFCIGILNAFNFMDGINGITGGYSLVVVGILCYVNSCQVKFVDTVFIYILLLSLFVFLYFNFRTKAKCFAGDVGAMSAAFCILFLLGMLIVATGDFSYIVLLVVYGIDSILTIVHRVLLKENIFKAHRKHLYQLLVNELQFPHLLVSFIYMLLQAIIALGFFLFQSYSYLYLIVIVTVLSLFYIGFMKKYFKLHVDA